jgi:acetyl esterase/lipase
VALDYRHAPAHRFPAQLDDVRRGLALVRDSAAAWSVDTGRVVLWGRSSGGHLALLAALGAAPVPGLRIRGVVAFYGPTNLAEGYRRTPRPDPIGVRGVLTALLGGSPDAMPARYAAASPVRWARAGVPPTLHVYGGRDHIVKPRFGRELHARLRAAGATSAYLELPWSEHGFNALLSGVGGQLSLYYSERFIAWALAVPPAARPAARHLPIRGPRRRAAYLYITQDPPSARACAAAAAALPRRRCPLPHRPN